MTGRNVRGAMLVATGVALALSAHALAQPPAGFELRTLARGLDEPTAYARTPEGRIYITQKKGVVRVLDHGRLATFLDLREEVNEFDERGLINIAVDPAFARTRRLYLLYTADLRRDDPDKLHVGRGMLISVRVSRSDPTKPEPGSRRTVLTGFKAQGPWHAAAGLAFDTRGRLLVGFGDGSPYYPKDFSRAALWTYDLDVLNGKIVRIDPASGRGSPANPFFDPRHPDSVRSKVLAVGFRNPFSIQVDPDTGDIVVGDVGTDQWEEVDVVPGRGIARGEDLNYGWPCYEGGNVKPARQPAYRTLPECVSRFYDRESNGTYGTVAPRYAYPGSGGTALVVGPRYRGSTYPEKYRDQTFLADWVDDRFWTLKDGEASSFGSAGWGNPVYIATGPNGAIRYLAFTAGTLNELVYVGGEGSNARRWLAVGILSGLASLPVAWWIAQRRRTKPR